MHPDQTMFQARQKFLQRGDWALHLARAKQSLVNYQQGIANLRAQGDLEPAGQSCVFATRLELIKLQYTAGLPMEALRAMFTQLVHALVDWHVAYREYLQALAQRYGEALNENASPLDFNHPLDYQSTIEICSLGFLLGEAEGLRRIDQLLLPYQNTDLLYEEIMGPAIGGARETTEYFHTRPYDTLIDALYALDQPALAAKHVSTYLEQWYGCFEGAPWHDGHLHAVPSQHLPYCGYWSFEAAAISVRHQLDDRSYRDHLLYPKDLADWARRHLSPDHFVLMDG